MATPFLFHGPMARDRAVERAEAIGRPLSDPIGDAGLRVEDSRTIVLLSNQSGVGDRAPSLVVGPLDGATPEAADALLKTLEDGSSGPLRLVLWADYLGGVRSTIRSRTHSVWCPVRAEDRSWIDPLHYLEEDAQKLLGHFLKEDWGRVIPAVLAAGKDWAPLLEALCAKFPEVLERGEARECALLLDRWPRIRRALDGRGGPTLAVDALLPREM
jgi:hypothetical protein